MGQCLLSETSVCCSRGPKVSFRLVLSMHVSVDKTAKDVEQRLVSL